jgi:hypothetical protein
MKERKTTSFQPDPEIVPVLQEQAEIQDRKISWLVNHYIKKGLEAEGLLKPKIKGKKGT